jgi:DNA repair protein RAD16
MKAAKDQQATRVAKRTKSVSSHYFQGDKSETANVGKSSEPLKDAADRESSDESDAKIAKKAIPAKNKGKAPQTESQAHYDLASDHANIVDRVPASKKELISSIKHEKASSQTQTANTSKSKGKGKARRIDTTSEEESESDDQLVLARPRTNGRKSATPRFKPVESDEDPLEIESEMIKAAIKLSKEESKSNALNSTSASRPIRSSSTKVTTSKHRNMLAEIDKEDDQDSVFVANFDHDDRSSLSTLDSDPDSSEESDSDADHQPTKSAQTAVPPKIRRTSHSFKIPKPLTWWQRNQMKLEAHHPELINVWGDLSQKVEVVQPSKAEQPDGLELTLLPFQLEGLYWMKKQETGPWSGGVLADEMGMGKTIQTIALILSDRIPGDRKQTLVIAPTVAIMQWRNEIEKFAKGITVNVWHGGNRSNAQEEMENFDVVLTSFAVLESAFRRQNSGFRRKGQIIKESSLLHQINWHRVILDEAHNIKDRSCNTAKGAFELKATYRWCLSGTPLQNRVGELYSLIRFLGADPFSYYFCKLCDCKSLHWSFSDRRSCDQLSAFVFSNDCVFQPIQLVVIKHHTR